MGSSQILALPNGALSRARFFQSQGVALKSAFHSTSGIRHDDGMIVFAMAVVRVRFGAWGCSCLLWTVKDHLVDDAGSLERLRHCRHALRQGVAEGFLLGKNNAPLERAELLTFRVVRCAQEYWARWGQVARAEIAGAGADGYAARSQ